MPSSKNIIGESKLPPFFKLSNPHEIGMSAPDIIEGDALRTWVRSLDGFQKEAIVMSTRTGEAWRLVSDEGAYLDGHDAACCPLAFLTTGMVASYTNEILALARQRGVELRNLRLVQDNYYTMKGSMPKRTMVGGALPVELLVEVNCDLSDNELRVLISDAMAASPINGLMSGRLPSLFALARNGQEIALSEAQLLQGDILPDPKNRFDKALPQSSPLEFMIPVGTTERKPVDKGTQKASSSLSAQQDRILNIGGIGKVQENGIKNITQLQYSPHGTSFRLLCEEASVNGGQGRAPDANTYVSAGIAFCFMTQFGRFASMSGLELKNYSIVQDTHFSLGGASGGTGKPGIARPVETHVHLTTNESDGIAREMLDISERTCFLHALCKTDLKPKLKVARS